MGFNIGGATVKAVGSGISLNGSSTAGIIFNANGVAAIADKPGFNGCKNAPAAQPAYSSSGSGWLINSANWASGLNTATGVFTCPVAGLYAYGWNGIANGGSGLPVGHNTYGYGGVVKNGVLLGFTHWNKADNVGWNQFTGSIAVNCAAGDTLALYVNQAPAPVSEAPAYGYGMYPNAHHGIWCVLIG